MNLSSASDEQSVLELVLEEEKIVRRRNGDDVLSRVPGGVQDLLIEVEAVDADLVLFPLAAAAHLARLEYRLRLGDFARRLQRDLALRRAVEHAEEVVVGAGHDRSIVAVPAALELVEDAIVLVQRAQFRPQVLVHQVSLNRLRLHVQIPHFDRHVITRNHIPARIRQLHIGYTRDDLGEKATIGWIFGFFE